MNHLYETANDVIDLSNTMLEGLQYMGRKMEEGQLQETLYLFEDVLEGWASIQTSIGVLIELEQQSKLDGTSRTLQESIERLARAYEEASLEKARAELQFALIPAYRKWQLDLEKSLKKYLES